MSPESVISIELNIVLGLRIPIISDRDDVVLNSASYLKRVQVLLDLANAELGLVSVGPAGDHAPVLVGVLDTVDVQVDTARGYDAVVVNAE